MPHIDLSGEREVRPDAETIFLLAIEQLAAEYATFSTCSLAEALKTGYAYGRAALDYYMLHADTAEGAAQSELWNETLRLKGNATELIATLRDEAEVMLRLDQRRQGADDRFLFAGMALNYLADHLDNLLTAPTDSDPDSTSSQPA